MLGSNKNLSLDHTMHALSDPTRRAILEQLGGGERRVTELAAPFSMSLNSVSKHIKILERGGLVQRRRAGREHFISANPAAFDSVAEWIAERRRFWNAKLDRLEAILAGAGDIDAPIGEENENG